MISLVLFEDYVMKNKEVQVDKDIFQIKMLSAHYLYPQKGRFSKFVNK